MELLVGDKFKWLTDQGKYNNNKDGISTIIRIEHNMVGPVMIFDDGSVHSIRGLERDIDEGILKKLPNTEYAEFLQRERKSSTNFRKRILARMNKKADYSGLSEMEGLAYELESKYTNEMNSERKNNNIESAAYNFAKSVYEEDVI